MHNWCWERRGISKCLNDQFYRDPMWNLLPKHALFLSRNESKSCLIAHICLLFIWGSRSNGNKRHLPQSWPVKIIQFIFTHSLIIHLNTQRWEGLTLNPHLISVYLFFSAYSKSGLVTLDWMVMWHTNWAQNWLKCVSDG